MAKGQSLKVAVKIKLEIKKNNKQQTPRKVPTNDKKKNGNKLKELSGKNGEEKNIYMVAIR